MHKQPEVTAATRKRLMDSFWSLYQDRPMEKISVSAIVERAGVHRSTFYEYFMDVYDVVEQTQQNTLEDLEKILSELDIPDHDAVAQIAPKLVAEIAPMAETIYYLCQDNRFHSRLIDMMKPYMLQISRLPEDYAHLDFLFTLMSSNMVTTLRYWHEHQEKYTAQELMVIAQKIMFHGAERILQESSLPR